MSHDLPYISHSTEELDIHDGQLPHRLNDTAIITKEASLSQSPEDLQAKALPAMEGGPHPPSP